MTDADPAMVRPTKVVAMAICQAMGRAWLGPSDADRKAATAVLNRLRELGAFNDQFYDAIKKEAGK